MRAVSSENNGDKSGGVEPDRTGPGKTKAEQTAPGKAEPAVLFAGRGGNAELVMAAPDISIAASAADDASTAIIGSGEKTVESGLDNAFHTRREWLLLGERIFSHPRYALLITAALGLCAFEQYPTLLVFMSLFFSSELALRFWLQKERSFANKSELGFLLLDSLATASLLFALLLPGSALGGGMYLRLARLMRGMYMLRMLRVFRFFTYETFIYSMPFAVSVLILTGMAVLMPETMLYAGIVLILESACRMLAVIKTLESGARRNVEIGLAVVDMAVCIPLLGIIPELSPMWALLRSGRFLIMLNPLGNLLLALKGVAGMDEVRKESAMLIGVFALLMALTSLSVLYIYPRMDLSGANGLGVADYAPWQVILYSFRFLLDPGNAPADAFSPLLALNTMAIVLAGVFFFALFVGLGANVMHYLLEKLANSPLSPRESLLFVGWSEQALPVLKVFDRMCARMRRSFASGWIFFGPVAAGARSLGRWLAVRQADVGERQVMRRFRLSGVRFTFLFQPVFKSWRDREKIVDLHAMMREAFTSESLDETRGMVLCDAALPEDILAVYQDSLGLDVLDLASLKARMLYQMHHCAHMPELGARMLDAVNGETGLYSTPWEVTLIPHASGTRISDGERQSLLEDWLVFCFERGVNLLAGLRQDGVFVLFADMKNIDTELRISDVVGLGCEPSTWPTLLRNAMQVAPAVENSSKNPSLKAFSWPETWDLHMIFLGWHDGLPAMIEEMAEKHHKLTIHVLYPGDETVLAKRQACMQASADRAAGRTGCAMGVQVHAWYGFSGEVLMPLLKGCKVIMIYPEDRSGGEDSLLEMWFHEVAHMLEARKAEVKWWTPPKLMVLPRDSAMIGGLRDAARNYQHLDIDIGSPDSFHDVFMARQLLSRALYHSRPEKLRQDKISYNFMQTVLGDAVIIEGVDAGRLLAAPDASWVQIYREAWHRGWMLTAYLLPDIPVQHDIFASLDKLFPLGRQDNASCMHLLAGAQIEEMDMPLHAVRMLFCRRGVLAESTKDKLVKVDVHTSSSTEKVTEKANSELNAKDMSVSADKHKIADTAVKKNGPLVAESNSTKATDDAVEDINIEDASQACSLTETAKEGEVMHQSVWPETADKRLLNVLYKQVAGALELLNSSTEDGLIKLTDAMDKDIEGVLADDIMAALTDLQNIDRVMQRLKNVEGCLSDWATAQHEQPTADAVWKNEVEKRYVMEEERQVLRSEL